ncbi:MAG: DsbA family protein [Pontibacterium sp.]
MKLYYVMDPMCSWCWAFRPNLQAALKKHPNLEVIWVMGGLAPDSDVPMPKEMQKQIQGYWHTIEERTGTTFNHDFWRTQQPKRSTFIACRAIIAAHFLRGDDGVFPLGGSKGTAPALVDAIQEAYYQHAQNPSDEQVLIALAEQEGFEQEPFAELLNSDETKAVLEHHLALRQQWGISGFPSIVFEAKGTLYPLSQGYMDMKKTIELVDAAISELG